MSSKGNEKFAIYTIPYNFIDESKVFGGMVATRNLIEGCVLGGIASVPVFLISFPLQVKLTLILVCFLVFGVIGCIGINGDPITRFIIYYIQFRRQKRIISFNGKVKFHESAADNIEFSELPRDRMLKLFSGMSSSRKAVEEQEEDSDTTNFVFDDDIISEENRQDIISKLLGKKSTAVYDEVYDSEAADEFLYGDDFNDAEEDDSVDIDEHDMHIEFSQNAEFSAEVELDISIDDLSFEVDESNDDVPGSVEYVVDTDDGAYDDDNVPTLNLDTLDLIDTGIQTTMEDSEESFVDVADVMRKAIQNPDEWQCKFCRTINDGKFCEECGSSKDIAELRNE